MNRLFALTVIALMGSASLAAAQNGFDSVNQRQASDNIVELGLVNTDGPGKVLIFGYQDGMLTDLLGSTDLMDGANPDVKVAISHPINRDAVAILVVDDRPVAAETLQFGPE